MKKSLLWLGLSLTVATTGAATGCGGGDENGTVDGGGPSTANSGGSTAGSSGGSNNNGSSSNGSSGPSNNSNGDDPDAGDNGGTSAGSTGSSTGATSTGTGGSTGGTTGKPPLVDGCAGQKLREGIPTDLGVRGPWPVGAITTTIEGLVTEVWYPAEFGSEAGKSKIVYSVEEHLPDTEKGKIQPPARSPIQNCDCYSQLPIDAEAGPYPVLVFVHGTAGFRTTNLENVQHWASRGFVVAAADHPGIQLKDMLGSLGGAQDQPGDARKVLKALAATAGDLAFLKDRIDMTRVGVMGHSAGGNAVSQLGKEADVIIPYAGGGALKVDRVKSAMYVTGDVDTVVAPGTASYDGTTTKPKRRVWIKGGGHLVGGSLCVIRDPTDPTKDIVDLANEFQIGNLLLRPFFGTLFNGCNDPPDAMGTFIPASRGIAIMNYVSTGQFEEALHCSATATAELAKTQMKFGADVSQFQEEAP
jgi:fermentation-respiration switch protein FrsA (DUF1100 family)